MDEVQIRLAAMWIALMQRIDRGLPGHGEC
jgi:hypothetical protein